jgi:hypothetical protein
VFLNVLASMQQFNTFYKLVSFEEFIELIILWKKSDAFGEKKNNAGLPYTFENSGPEHLFFFSMLFARKI